MNYSSYHFWGMRLLWWIVWGIILFWIIAIPYDIPGQRTRKETPLDILKKRFPTGEINKEEFQEKKIILES